jgi:uncharacterized protein YfcZ (UPF0381/DUF406 family)
MRLYKVSDHRRPGKPCYSIDRVMENGTFLSQEACWFDARSKAEERMAEIIEQDRLAGLDAEAWES